MARAETERLPRQIRYLAWNEGCERFSFYGMSSVLTIYMARHLGFPDSDAEANYHLFVFAAYLTPLAGAWLADRFLGRYSVILFLSLGYVLGHGTLAAFESETGLLVGLCLIAAGAGGIKPCAAAFVGDQFTRDNRHLIRKVYDLYYWMINLGSFTASLLIPELLDRFGARVAFAVPGLLMAMALVIFRAGRPRYVLRPPSGPNRHGFFRVVGRAVSRLGTGRLGQPWLEGARDVHPAEAVEGARAVFRIVGIFAPIVAFWSLFFQYGSSWVLQAEKMERGLLGYQVKASQMGSLEAVFVLLVIPVFAGWLYPFLERRGLRVTPLRRMGAGMFVAVLSFVWAAGVQMALDGGGRPHVLWQVPAYLLMAVAEVLISVTALEFAYTQAPVSMKSVIMSLWYLTISVGSLLTATVAKLNKLHGAGYFVLFAILMFAGAMAFVAVARRYRPVEFIPAGEEAEAA